MRCNPRMRDILRATDVTRLSDRDIPLMFREVVERGWSVTTSGGRVLTALRTEVPGIHSDRLAEETTVNGRGIPYRVTSTVRTVAAGEPTDIEVTTSGDGTRIQLPGSVDRTTPKAVVQLLSYWHRTPESAVFRNTLPILGVDGLPADNCTDCRPPTSTACWTSPTTSP
ncbi:hypothetical protein R2B67_19045 [Streptomyces cyaneofuscatus]|uniref:hypothetical protein n=1 Tax=Streptomyces cyaneofuscatus TaxID=66883 RepID=UPI00295494B6|nr:hypothetical protein [Streptomyces cyaneofuscatus]WOP10509.1 hypothetical protein R2B67_19045 [Streptomyces cyaneofuscatus]